MLKKFHFIKAINLFILTIFLVSSFLSIVVYVSNNKAAAQTSGFNPGHIIDNTIFTNSSSMTVQQIQNFLEAQNPNCDTNGTQSITYYYNSSTGEVAFSSFSGSSQVTTTRATYGQKLN